MGLTEVSKGAFGGWGERDGGEGTHYLISKDEYGYNEKLHRKNNNERLELAAKVQELEQEKKKLVEEYEYKLRKLKESCADVYEAEIEKAQDEADYQKRLNENLLRINKERANSQRDIKPKKERSGYIITSYEQKILRVKIGDYMYDRYAWETVVQSPYPIDMDADVAKKCIERDIYPKFSALGIENTEPEDYEIAYTNSDCKGKNLLVRSRMKANLRDGFWEIALMHTKALKQFPKDMLK